jgi:hypothetical protein
MVVLLFLNFEIIIIKSINGRTSFFRAFRENLLVLDTCLVMARPLVGLSIEVEVLI